MHMRYENEPLKTFSLSVKRKKTLFITRKSFDFSFLEREEEGRQSHVKIECAIFFFKAVNMNVFTALITSLLYRQIIVSVTLLTFASPVLYRILLTSGC